MYLDGLLVDLFIFVPKPIMLHCDNKVVQHIATNLVFHERTKLFNIDYYYVRDKVQEGFVQTSHVQSSLQLVDIVTKALGEQQYKFLLFKLVLVTHPSSPLTLVS